MAKEKERERHIQIENNIKREAEMVRQKYVNLIDIKRREKGRQIKRKGEREGERERERERGREN